MPSLTQPCHLHYPPDIDTPPSRASSFEHTLTEPLTFANEEGRSVSGVSADCLICMLPVNESHKRRDHEELSSPKSDDPTLPSYAPPPLIRSCQCQYSVHLECLYEWCQTKPECPLCREAITDVNGRLLQSNTTTPLADHDTNNTPTARTSPSRIRLTCELMSGFGFLGWLMVHVLRPYTNNTGGGGYYPNGTIHM